MARRLGAAAPPQGLTPLVTIEGVTVNAVECAVSLFEGVAEESL